MPTKETYFENLRRGDAETVNQMVKAELPRVYNLCLRLSRNPADAEDLTQETFVHAVRALPNFKGESLVSTWLYRIAVNVWKNRVRYEHSRHAKKHVSLSAPRSNDDDAPLDVAGIERPPEEWVALNADHQLLLQAMTLLEHEDRVVLVLRDLENRSYEDIANVLDMNLGTLKSRISRAREKLRLIYRRLGGQQA